MAQLNTWTHLDVDSVQVKTSLGEILEFLTEELIALEFVVVVLSGSHVGSVINCVGR